MSFEPPFDQQKTADLEQMKNLGAFKVLLDVERTYALLESVADDEQLFRIYWLACLSLLRTISDVLKHDIEDNPKLKIYWEKRVSELKALENKYDDQAFSDCPDDYLYWTRLFKLERNSIIHDYVFGISDPIPLNIFYNQEIFDADDTTLHDVNLYRPMNNIEEFGDMDCRDWISSAIIWWKNELKQIIQHS